MSHAAARNWPTNFPTKVETERSNACAPSGITRSLRTCAKISQPRGGRRDNPATLLSAWHKSYAACKICMYVYASEIRAVHTGGNRRRWTFTKWTNRVPALRPSCYTAIVTQHTTMRSLLEVTRRLVIEKHHDSYTCIHTYVYSRSKASRLCSRMDSQWKLIYSHSIAETNEKYIYIYICT